MHACPLRLMVPIEYPIAMSSSVLNHKLNDGQVRKVLFPSFELFRGRDQLKAIYLDPEYFKTLRTQERKNSRKQVFLAILTQVSGTSQHSTIKTNDSSHKFRFSPFLFP